MEEINKQVDEIIQREVRRLTEDYLACIAALVQQAGGKATVSLHQLEPFLSGRKGMVYHLDPANKDLVFEVVSVPEGELRGLDTQRASGSN